MTKKTEPQDKEHIEIDEVLDAPEQDEKQEDVVEEVQSEITIKQSEYDTLQNELAESKDKYVRLFAEFDNARKRMDREKMEYVRYANEDVLKEILNVADSLELSFRSAQDKTDVIDPAFLKGIEMVMTQVHDILKNNDVTPIKALGTVFDLNCHEVLMQEESDKHEDNMIIEEFQKGYKMGDRVIRTAKVKIAKNNK